MRDRPPPALLLGEHITALAVVRGLGRHGVPTYVASRNPALVRRSRWYRAAPGTVPDETPDPEPLAAYLRALPFERAVLFPCSDNWTLAVASLPDDVATRFPASVPPPGVVRTLTDKEGFADVSERYGVSIPRTIPVRGVAALEALSDDELPGFFLKPCDSQAFGQRYGTKGVMLTDRDQARAQVRRLAADGMEMLLQEYIPGPPSEHVFLDGFVDRTGELRACLARRRLRMYPPGLGNSTLSVTLPPADAAQGAEDLRRLFAGISFAGLFDAEFKRDPRDGRLKALEVNARPWWQLEIARAAGLALPLMCYRDALGLPLEPVRDYRVGRTWVNPVPDARAWWATRATPGGAGPFPLRAWLRAGNAVFSWDDPAPMLEEIAHAGRRATQVVRRGIRARPRRPSPTPTPAPAPAPAERVSNVAGQEQPSGRVRARRS